MGVRQSFFRELPAYGLGSFDESLPRVSLDDVRGLPEPALRYLRFMRVLGRPRDWSFRLHYTGKFRPRRGAGWAKCEVWQYNSALAASRVSYMQVRMAGVVPLLGRSTYVDGRGRSVGRLYDWVRVADGEGPEYDASELVTYLNDAVLLAPSMLFSRTVTWRAVDELSFDLILKDHGREVAARVFIDARGAPVNFRSNDRFCGDTDYPTRLRRTRWSTPVARYVERDGRLLPEQLDALWHPPQGEFSYLHFALDDAQIAFNVPADEGRVGA